MSSGGVRVPIPASTRKMILNIKEIAGNHSDEEILVMLQEYGMDPDETAQRLLLLDPFHEVKRKRDKRKENLINKDSAESRWRPGNQGRRNRGGWVNFSSHYTSHDAGGTKNSPSRRENGTKQVPEKVADILVSTFQETKDIESAPLSSSPTILANGSSGVPSGSSNVLDASNSACMGQLKPTASPVGTNKLESAPSAVDTHKSHGTAFGSGDLSTQLKSIGSPSRTPASSSEIHFSSSGPVLGIGQTPREQHVAGNNFPNKPHGVGKTHLTDPSQLSRLTSAHSNNLGSRSSSNYTSRSQQMIGPQKAGSNKEWKPMPVNPNPSKGSGTSSASEVPMTMAETVSISLPVSDILSSEEATSRLQKKLEELHIPQRQQVIIPNHIQVPEAERTKLSFGSFDAGVGITSSRLTGPENEKSSTPLSPDIEETLEEEVLSNQSASAVEKEGDYPASAVEKEGDYLDKREIPCQVPEDFPGVGAVSANTVQEYNESKQESQLMSGNNQNSVVHTSPSYNIGIVPPAVGRQVSPFENSESQARDASRVSSFVVQQPFDPASYNAQFYCSNADMDSRISPFVSPGVSSKCNGNVTVLPLHTSQSPQEGGNSFVLSAVSPTPLATQAAGFTQSSIAVSQQPVPVFRPLAGLHISHYPPNYIPYGHYFSPFYVPPPAISQILNNCAFAQQPQAGGVYPGPPPAAASGVKYSLPQYKPGTNTGNLTHLGMSSGCRPYGSFPAGYNPSSATPAGNSTSNEGLCSSQLKDSNAYSSGQQTEGSPVWIAAPGRDVSSLPVSSFYNLPSQGQHVTFAPTQAAHGIFASMYHPVQAVTAATVRPLLQQSQAIAGPVDMGGPAASVYQQQPQQTQIKWLSNY